MGVPWWVWPQSVAWLLAHGYLWHRLVVATGVPVWARRVGGAVLAVLGLSIPGALIAMHLMSPAGGRWITWPGFVWYGVVVYLLLVLVPVDLVRLVVFGVRRVRARRKGARPTSPGGLGQPGRPGQPGEPGVPRLPGVPRQPVPGQPERPGPGQPERPGPGQPERPGPGQPGRPGRGQPGQPGGPGLDRRRFLARAVALGAVGVSAGVVGYGMATAFSTPRLERVTVPLRRLPAAAEGYRIALVSDLHIGPLLGRDNLQRVVDLINGTRPDLVVIPGDLVDGTVTDLRSAVQPLAELRSRHGTYFTTGNHEYLWDADAWVTHLRTLGVHPLRNSRTALPHFDLAGVNDHTGAEQGDPPDYPRALAGREPGRPVVLLAHQPIQAEDAERYQVDLQLSGHTHGGQFFPGGLLNGVTQPVVSGLGRIGDTTLYVTRGSGFWGPPIRVGSPPEVTLVELAREEGASQNAQGPSVPPVSGRSPGTGNGVFGRLSADRPTDVPHHGGPVHA